MPTSHKLFREIREGGGDEAKCRRRDQDGGEKLHLLADVKVDWPQGRDHSPAPMPSRALPWEGL